MRSLCAPLTLCIGLLPGCQDARPQPTLAAVVPLVSYGETDLPSPESTGCTPGTLSQAYSDADIRLAFLGSSFIPAMTLDPGSGRRIATTDGFHIRMGMGEQWTELRDLVWLSTGQLAATLPADSAKTLPVGCLNVELRDPRGEKTELPAAFYELGSDTTVPTIHFSSPPEGSIFAPGKPLQGSISAFALPPSKLASLDWTYSESSEGEVLHQGHCLPESSPSEVDCAFSVQISDPLPANAVLTISASATKDLNPPSVEWQSRTFSWHAKPTVVSISPASGGSAGGTDVVVRGSGFLPGSKATLDGVQLFPGGGIIMEGNEFILSGHVPAHSAGSATLVVHTPLGDSPSLSGAFTYLDPPLLLKIEPNTDGTAGGSPVTLTGQGFDDQTQIYFGQTLESAVSLLDSVCTSATTILGRTPPGTGQTTVWAFAPALGWTKLVAEFSWMTP